MKTRRLYGGWLAIPLTIGCALAGALSYEGGKDANVNRYTCVNPGSCDCGRREGDFCQHWPDDAPDDAAEARERNTFDRLEEALAENQRLTEGLRHISDGRTPDGQSITVPAAYARAWLERNERLSANPPQGDTAEGSSPSDGGGAKSWWALPLVLLAGATLDATTR